MLTVHVPSLSVFDSALGLAGLSHDSNSSILFEYSLLSKKYFKYDISENPCFTILGNQIPCSLHFMIPGTLPFKSKV